MNEKIHSVYFLGIGGIGMSALARYFLHKGMLVGGYDRVATPLTAKLETEGMQIHYKDDPLLIAREFSKPENTLVIYTPAIPPFHKELNYFRNNGYQLHKRAEVLGSIINNGTGIAVAGTHGKTSVSSLTAHLLHDSGFGCNAFLGGISINYNSNYILNDNSDIYVVEADEYDRSFLSLNPQIAVITAVDADHLDIYGNRENIKAAFQQFASQVKTEGVILMKKNVDMDLPGKNRILYYSMNEKADYFSYAITQKNPGYIFSLHTPYGDFHEVHSVIPGRINIENTIAAFAAAMEAGARPEKLLNSLKTYKGIKRRFEIIINSPNLVYIDDYAHHPEELKALINSLKEIFPGKDITGIFQPHLFTRTRDFASEFAKSLSLLDDVILLDIYPAREEPLPGIDSGIIFKQLRNTGRKILCRSDELLNIIANLEPKVILTIGAGDIDQMVEPLKQKLLTLTS